ncbi:MAG TPA: hypothetical protein VEH02_10435 [Pseudolabrys sp.]|nr:hypothetical protein [Pseudolabrys sp.]
MRLNFTAAVLGCALAGTLSASLSAWAEWHSPNFSRQTDGTWTNIHYDDGVCNYYYSHNSYDNQTNLNKYGDCSRVAIGPDGTPMPVTVVPGPRGRTVEVPVPYGATTVGSGVGLK